MGKTNKSIVRASAASTSSYVASTAFACSSLDWVEVEIDMIAGAASDQAMVVLEITKDDLSTPTASRVWKPLTAQDGTLTSQSIGTPPTSAAYGNFGFAVPGYYNVVLTTPVAAALNDKVTRSAVLFVGSAKYIRAQVKAAAGTPAVAVTMSGFSTGK